MHKPSEATCYSSKPSNESIESVWGLSSVYNTIQTGSHNHIRTSTHWIIYFIHYNFLIEMVLIFDIGSGFFFYGLRSGGSDAEREIGERVPL